MKKFKEIGSSIRKFKGIVFIIIILIIGFFSYPVHAHEAGRDESYTNFKYEDDKIIATGGKSNDKYFYRGSGYKINWDGFITKESDGSSLKHYYKGPSDNRSWYRGDGNRYFIQVREKGVKKGTLIHMVDGAFRRVNEDTKVISIIADNSPNSSNSSGNNNSTGSSNTSNSSSSSSSSNQNQNVTSNNPSSNTNDFKSKLFPGLTCSGTNTLKCWLDSVFDWASVILASAAVIAIMAGGIMYMTSGGNPDQLGKAKKIIFNALAGVAVLVLARFFMKYILGAPWIL